MKNLNEALRQENKTIKNGGQLFFDSHGIYLMVSSNLEKMPDEKFYVEKFVKPSIYQWDMKKDIVAKRSINWGCIAMVLAGAMFWTVFIIGIFALA